MPSPHHRPKGAEQQPEEICLFAQTNFRNQMRRFGVKLDDRRRHMYIIGKTGMGKTTMMENMVLHDIYAGHGVGVVDPHGDFAEKILDYIPSNRINDVVYFNPADVEFPIGFNILEVKSEEQKHLVASGLMAIFKKIWPDVWSARMEYILNNTLLALLDYPNSTLLGINRLLADKKYRKKVVRQLKDPVVKAFWENEFANYPDRYMTEAVAPIQNKIGQFLSASVIRNMVAQVKSTIDIREIMDSKKIFIMNLSKGRIGEDNSRLLGGMLVTEIQLAAMERVDTPEAERKDFFLYVDEFQNFATPSFANILSEARKYRLSLILAHQYVAQLDEVVSDAVFGNVGTIVSFRVGAADAEELAKEYAPVFTEEDIVNLAKYQIYLKLMIDGVASQPFSAMTMPPIGSPTGSLDKVIRVSRERYGKPRADIEDKIMRWSGFGPQSEEGDDDEHSETPGKESGTKEKKKEEKKSSDGTSEKKKPPHEKTSESSVSDKEKHSQKNDEVKALPPAPVNETQVENDVDASVSISLQDLLPQVDEHEQVREEEVSEEDVSHLLESTVEPFSHNEPEKASEKEKEGEILSEEPKKKKRKRKRKKKKKKNGEGEENLTGQLNENNNPIQQPASLEKQSEQSREYSEEKKKEEKPKPIDPDDVISFE